MTDWKGAARAMGRPLIMGILNVTPDSISDGVYTTAESAVRHAMEMADAGADIIDVGGESTRPGATPVSLDEELRRVIPVIETLSDLLNIPISVDTMKSRVAERALDAGADIINDILGLRGDGMMELVASAGVPVVIMHMHGTPATLGCDFMGDGALQTIKTFLLERTGAAMDAGIREEDIILDPGIGFGTTAGQSAMILESCAEFGFGHAVLAGPSRKRFLAHRFPGMDSDSATAEACRIAMASGADIVRVHNVPLVKKALEFRTEP